MTSTAFNSRKAPLFGIVVLGSVLAMLVVLAFELDRLRQPGAEVQVLGLIVLGLAIGLMIWLWFDTGYTINGAFVYYRSGPFRGKIRIKSIHEVVVNTTLWAGFRPALAQNGLIVKHTRYGEIYFSPDSNQAFVDALLKVNPEIKVTDRG